MLRQKAETGKTAAFGLGLLQKLDVTRFRVQALVLCPTRELADQVAKEIRKLGRGIHNIKGSNPLRRHIAGHKQAHLNMVPISLSAPLAG
ncbi:MAG: DEAD/DEAH box helicase [Porticoccaceae bacterium]